METVFKTTDNRGSVVFRTSKGELVKQGARTIQSGIRFSKLIDTSKVKFTSSFSEGGVDETVKIMCEIIKKHHLQVYKLAKHLEKPTKLETLQAIWDFVFNHIQYKNDKKGVEQVSTPARIWLNRSTPNTPSDCDDHSIFVGSLLYCLGIPFSIRIAGYEGKPYSHVYIVVGDVCIDTVLHRFNHEAQYTSKKDTQMQIETLAGYDEGPVSNELGALEELHESGVEFDNTMEEIENTEELNGFSESILKQEENALRRLSKSQLETTLREYNREPEVYHALGFGPEYWQHMSAALKCLNENSSLQGIIIQMQDGENWEKANLSPINGVQGLDGHTVGLLSGLSGFFKKLRHKIKKGFKAIKKGLKKFGKWTVSKLKKVGKFLQKINPINIAIRAVLRSRISKNKKGMALKMGYGLLTWSQAQQLGIKKDAWEKSKRAYSKFAKKYRFLGGKRSKLNKILAAAWQKAAQKENMPSMKLAGMLGDLNGRRRRRRRRRRRAARAAAAKANAALARKYKQLNTPYEKERLKFLKLVHKDVARQEKLAGLGIVATAASGAVLAKVALILAPILAILKKLGLGDFITKAKEKHIENLSARIEAETDPVKKQILIDKKARAENNLVVFNNAKEKYTPKSKPNYSTPNQQSRTYSTPNVSISPDTPITTAPQVSTASMNPWAIGAMVLVGGGLLFGSKNKKVNKSKK